MMQPFIVYALPRSRTAWLSSFLSYGGIRCGHEQAIFMRDVSDIAQFFRGPHTGTVETAAAQGWKILHHHVPGLKVVVVKRPIDEVIDSMMNVDMGGVATYDRNRLMPVMEYGDRMLDQVSKQAGVLTITHADLATRDGCAAVFEHCLPHKFDKRWWASLKDKNIQVSIPEMLAYFHCNRSEIENFKRLCRSEMRMLFKAGLIASERLGS